MVLRRRFASMDHLTIFLERHNHRGLAMWVKEMASTFDEKLQQQLKADVHGPRATILDDIWDRSTRDFVKDWLEALRVRVEILKPLDRAMSEAVRQKIREQRGISL